MSAAYLRGIYLRLAGVLALTVALALLANAVLTHRTFERTLAPQMAAKVASVGASVRALAFQWADNGVELKDLHGVNRRFIEAMAEGPEISYMAITDTQGAILHESSKTPHGAAEHFRSAPVLALLETSKSAGPLAHVEQLYIVSMPMVMPGRPLGTLHLGVDSRFVDHLVIDMLYDVVVVLVVTLFFTLELLHFIAGVKLENSLRMLGDAFQRGVAGNFTTRPRRATEPAFDGLLLRMDAILAHVNQAYAALARRVDESRRAPAHERRAGTAEAMAGLKSLAR